ncbi:hypothetical protein, partial [Candidatus Symbiopectobacterium sp. NZEC135]|uniref:hypothetical protein n=1 Tax=Candidatus Symbiopectobacterium sp. NZEC135 TaxID=2820471 RepID=UPI002227E272
MRTQSALKKAEEPGEVCRSCQAERASDKDKEWAAYKAALVQTPLDKEAMKQYGIGRRRYQANDRGRAALYLDQL